MISSTFVRSARHIRPRVGAIGTSPLPGFRSISTLEGNPHIYVFKHPKELHKSTLSLLPTEPPTAALALGTSSSIPPTPESFTENHNFLSILQSVLSAHASQDPTVKQQAAVFASPSSFTPGNRGGWIHVSDSRNPPDYGRIAWPEDIFGSLEVDGEGKIVAGNGNYQASGTYRMVTREGILGLPDFLREKLVERLQELERQIKRK